MAEVSKLLAGARASFDEKDFTACLTALLEAWRVWPNPVVAEVLEKIGERVDGELAASDWDVGRFDSRSLPRLLQWLSTQPAGPLATTALKRLPALALPDPRATAPLLALLSRFKDSESTSAVELALTRNRDPRVLELGPALPAALRTRLTKMTPPPPPEDDESSRHVLGLRAACMGDAELAQTREQHLARLVAHPDDPVAVAVVGDFLSAMGDPLGELISLQLARGAGGPSVQERILLHQHGRTWSQMFLGAGMDGATFERGVPSRIDCSYTPRVGPGWRSIRHLSVGSGADWPAFKDILGNLETLEGVGCEFLPDLLAVNPMSKLRRLELVSTKGLELFAAPGVFPSLSSAHVLLDEKQLPAVLASRLAELPELELNNHQWLAIVTYGERTTLEFKQDGFRRKKPTKRDVQTVRKVTKLISDRWPGTRVKVPTALRDAAK